MPQSGPRRQRFAEKQERSQQTKAAIGDLQLQTTVLRKGRALGRHLT
jgi:hypothetical protein